MKAAILDFRPAAAPAIAVTDTAAMDVARHFALDRLAAVRGRLVCRWRRRADGRLNAVWEPDSRSVPHL
jgi:hypothetical protein